MSIAPKLRVAILVVFVAVAFVLRVYDLGAAGLSEDEVHKVEAARGYLAGDFSHNLEHPMLMKLQIAACLLATDAWNARAPESLRIAEEVPIRLPNVIFGALMTVVIYLFASFWFGVDVGLISAAFWATGISAITVDRIAKEDTLLVFFCWLAFYLYARAKALGDAGTLEQRRWYGASGASFGLMLASKYFPHYFGLHFLYYHLVGRSELNMPLTKRDYRWLYGGVALFFFLANPTALLPSTWYYWLNYTEEGTVTHHGYFMMGQLYKNNFLATFQPGENGLPIYFYPLLLVLKTPIPVLACVVVGLWVAIRSRREPRMFFLLFMFVMWIVPFSFVAAKWMRYILSFMPMMYILAALGVVEMARLAGAKLAPAMRPALAVALAIVFVLVPVQSAVAAAPYYSLYLNPLGGGRTGYFFPHDEFYDAGLREAIKAICEEAPPNALVFGEAPPVFEYYFKRFGREDLRFAQLSALTPVERTEVPSYVVVQDGRLYFENVDYIKSLEALTLPNRKFTVEGADAARVYSGPDLPEVSSK